MATLLLTAALATGCNDAPAPTDTTATTSTQEETEIINETDTEALTDAQSETALQTEPETEAVTDPTTEPVTEPETRPEIESEPAIKVEERIIREVCIVAGDSASEQYAAAELTEYLTRIGLEMAEDGYLINLSVDPAMPDDSYRMVIQRKNRLGTAITGGKRGVIYGAYRFLEEFGGVRFFTPDLEVVPEADRLTLTTGVIESGAFELRQIDWYSVRNEPDWCVKNGINYSHWYGSFSEDIGGSWNWPSGSFVHTMAGLTGTPSDSQPCLSNPQILEKAKRSVRAILEANPDADVISVSQNDNQNYCTCAACRTTDLEEGSPAGTLLRFVNAIAADVAEDYPNVVIETLAYQYTRKAPSVTKPLPNVAIRLCSIECCFTHSLSDVTCDENRDFANDIVEWSQICDRIYVWDYTANYSYYIPTFPNFHVLRNNMRFFAEHNVKGMFPEGNYSSASGEFGELRAYLLAKLMMDPEMSANEYYQHMDEFLQAYYGEGWIYVRAYIDFVCGEAAGAHSHIHCNPFSMISEEKYAAMEETLEAWWNKAEELAGDRLAYVQRSRLQWRYLKLMLHPDEEVAREFVADVETAGVYWNEWRTTQLPPQANLTLPPDHWDWDY